MLQRWCGDGEAPEPLSREGQKGRTGHRWLVRGVRPPGRRDRRLLSPFVFAAVPRKCLRRFGEPGRAALQVPGTVTLLPLPPCSPELSPVERAWLCLRERFLLLRLYRSEQAITDAPCAAWNALPDGTGRLAALTSHPGITQAIHQVSR